MPPDVHHMRVVRGPVVTEVHQVFSDYTSAVIRSAFQMISWVFCASPLSLNLSSGLHFT